MWVNVEMNASDAFVAAWLPGSEGKAVADVLLTDRKGQLQYDFTGKLSFSWPNSPEQLVNRFDKDKKALLPYGYGLKYGEATALLTNLKETYQRDEKKGIARQVFDGKLQKPWQMRLVADEQDVLINSSSQVLSGIKYRTIDKQTQEDACKLTLDGSSDAGVSLSVQMVFVRIYR